MEEQFAQNFRAVRSEGIDKRRDPIQVERKSRRRTRKSAKIKDMKIGPANIDNLDASDNESSDDVEVLRVGGRKHNEGSGGPVELGFTDGSPGGGWQRRPSDEDGAGDRTGSEYSRGSVHYLYANPGYGRQASIGSDHRGRLPQY